MGNVASVVLVGRLTRDAELKYTSTGTPISEFSLAVNTRKKQGDKWVEEANFFDVVLFGKMAEGVSQYLTKGKEIAVVGSLKQDRWQGSDGGNRSKIKVLADRVEFVGGKDE